MPGRPVRYDTAKADMIWPLVYPGFLLLGYDTIPGRPVRYDTGKADMIWQLVLSQIRGIALIYLRKLCSRTILPGE